MKLKLVVPVVAVAALVAMLYGVREFRQRAAAATVTNELDQMRASVAAEHPDQPVSAAMAKKAKQSLNARLASETDAKKKFLTAASTFYGFYVSNTRALPAYCKEQGVDLTPFVAAFARANMDELAHARRAAPDPPVGMDEFYAHMAATMRKMAAQSVGDLAKQSGRSLKQACQLANEKADVLAEQASFARLQPAAHQVLMASY